MEEPEEDPALREIRKRKEETAARYDQRLQYLRAKLKGADLRDADLSEANLSKANLLGANLTGTALKQVNLTSATLPNSRSAAR